MRWAALLLLLGACGAGAHGRGPDGVLVVVGARGALVEAPRLVDVPAAGELRVARPPGPLTEVSLLAEPPLPVRSSVLEADALVVDLAPGRSGRREVVLRFRLPGVSWQASHVVVFAADGRSAEVRGRVELLNPTRVGLGEARVVLVEDGTGDRAAPRRHRLPGRIRLPAAATTQVPLGPPRRVRAENRLVYDPLGELALSGGERRLDPDFPAGASDDVRAYLELALPGGEPLPAGTLRFFRREADGRLAWLEDRRVDTLPAGAHLRVALGSAGELRGTRRQVDFDADEERRLTVEEVELTLANRGAREASVTVLERLPRGEAWRLTWWSEEPEKEDAQTIRFEARVPAHGEHKIRYRVVYSWGR